MGKQAALLKLARMVGFFRMLAHWPTLLLQFI